MKAPPTDPSRTRDGRYAVVVGEPVGERHEEAHIVDALAVGYRCAAPVGPAEIDSVRVDHRESVLVGDGVVVGQRRLRPLRSLRRRAG